MKAEDTIRAMLRLMKRTAKEELTHIISIIPEDDPLIIEWLLMYHFKGRSGFARRWVLPVITGLLMALSSILTYFAA
jgi:hypothetical protein